MSHFELVKVLMFVSASYVGKFKYPSDDDVIDASVEEAWMVFMKDYSYQTIMMLLKDYIPKNPDWPPTIGQIIKAYKTANESEGKRMTAGEAWDLVISNLQKGKTSVNYPVIIKQAIVNAGGITYIDDNSSTNPFVHKKFIDAYESLSERIEHDPSIGLIESVHGDAKLLAEKFKGE